MQKKCWVWNVSLRCCYLKGKIIHLLKQCILVPSFVICNTYHHDCIPYRTGKTISCGWLCWSKNLCTSLLTVWPRTYHYHHLHGCVFLSLFENLFCYCVMFGPLLPFYISTFHLSVFYNIFSTFCGLFCFCVHCNRLVSLIHLAFWLIGESKTLLGALGKLSNLWGWSPYWVLSKPSHSGWHLWQLLTRRSY